MQILLLDMDSVLLNPVGYYRALQETIRLVAKTLGFTGRRVTQDEIQHFEAAGVTSEWESSAICACLMLTRAWRAGIDMELPDAPPLPVVEPHGLDWPDLTGFFGRLAKQDSAKRAALRAEELLIDPRLNPSQEARIRQLLHRARRIEGSLTHRLFQELALGSLVFQQTYHMEPYLHCPSYLFEYDQSLLTPAHQAHLLAWLDQPDHAAVIFTNRPSAAPDGFFDTPEAELGREAVGLERVPIIGAGGAGWLAEQHGLDYEAYLKPSMVHALSALAVPNMGDQQDAFLAAHKLASGESQAGFEHLHGARVFVFEDSVKGMRSAQDAKALLAKYGINIDLVLLGISPEGPKRDRLRAYGVDVYDEISSALLEVPGVIAA
jgi:phosphoglycolate phosphatase-like HAD superfamily hydrolase